ncbi:MAG: muraminidase [Rhodanobacter sp. SCN 67-45]|nr:MAG: muraminidase [Rhodanobacter sp. SCN 67-45]
MQPSQAAIDLIKAAEGLRLTAYRDSAGILTIGYGSTGGIKPGQTITPEQAEAMLVDDLDEAADAVRKLVTVPLTQGQFDALVSFTFNLGAGRLRDSTLLRLLNQGKYGEASNQFQYWTLVGGVRLLGLVRRRKAEADLFKS